MFDESVQAYQTMAISPTKKHQKRIKKKYVVGM